VGALKKREITCLDGKWDRDSSAYPIHYAVEEKPGQQSYVMLEMI
jgi:hypothetical protein